MSKELKSCIGKVLKKESIERFNFYHYVNGKSKEYLKLMENQYDGYNENGLKEEIFDDCWIARFYVPEGCCIQANAMLAIVLDDKNVIKDIKYLVEYIHRPGDYVPYLDGVEDGGNFYGFQGLKTPYMIEEEFQELSDFNEWDI